MNEYLVEFDDEASPNSSIQPKCNDDINIVLNECKDDILETYEEHNYMNHVNEIFSTLKPQNNEKMEVINKLNDLKTKYPDVACKQITLDDNLDDMKQIYNNFRYDIIKHLGDQVLHENDAMNEEIDEMTETIQKISTAIVGNVGETSQGVNIQYWGPNFWNMFSENLSTGNNQTPVGELMSNFLVTMTELMVNTNKTDKTKIDVLKNKINNIKHKSDGCEICEEDKCDFDNYVDSDSDDVVDSDSDSDSSAKPCENKENCYKKN